MNKVPLRSRTLLRHLLITHDMCHLSDHCQGLLKSFLPRGVNYWIGLSDLAHEGHYVWDREGTEGPLYPNWDINQPNGGVPAEDCVFLVRWLSLDSL